jgi:hypothetical protein
MAMTTGQYQQLASLFVDTQKQGREEMELARTARTLDTCDGSDPESTRQWITEMDGFATEPSEAMYIIRLAKATTTGGLWNEIRRWTNGDPPEANTWDTLRPHILETFLSACETIKLQTRLEASKQKLGESTPSYIRRFRTEAARAYPDKRADSAEARVVAAFLRRFADRRFAERLFRTGRTQKLASMITATLVRRRKPRESEWSKCCTRKDRSPWR